MPKLYSEMTHSELICEAEAWIAVSAAEAGPNFPSAAARDGADAQYKEVCAWIARRALQPQN